MEPLHTFLLLWLNKHLSNAYCVPSLVVDSGASDEQDMFPRSWSAQWREGGTQASQEAVMTQCAKGLNGEVRSLWKHVGKEPSQDVLSTNGSWRASHPWWDVKNNKQVGWKGRENEKTRTSVPVKVKSFFKGPEVGEHMRCNAVGGCTMESKMGRGGSGRDMKKGKKKAWKALEWHQRA